MFSLVGKTMLAAVQFNVQFRLLAKEIKVVNAEWMLAAELVAAESSVTQAAPHDLFRPRFLFAKLASVFSVGLECEYGKCGAKMKFVFLARPHPDLLPRGEGTAIACFWFFGRPFGKFHRKYFKQAGTTQFTPHPEIV
jgi:hypothetical protein